MINIMNKLLIKIKTVFESVHKYVNRYNEIIIVEYMLKIF